MKSLKLCIIVLILPLMLSGCRLIPVSLKPGKVESLAKEAINPRVHMTNPSPEKVKLYDGIHRTYSFEDERGIPFTVEVASHYFSFVEFIRGIYEDHAYIYTDYRKSVMAYYDDQVKDIISNVDGIDFDPRFNDILIVTDEKAFDSLEDMLFQMDELYNFDYSYSGKNYYKINQKALWYDTRFFDYIIRYNGNQENIFFSISENERLTHDDIQAIINGLTKEK